MLRKVNFSNKILNFFNNLNDFVIARFELIDDSNLNRWKTVITYIHTYIIGHYNPSVRIIDLVSHTTYVVCFNFIHKWRDLQF